MHASLAKPNSMFFCLLTLVVKALSTVVEKSAVGCTYLVVDGSGH